jgi:uncharacterized protein YdhG (YjbR/CyaY superfamily)
MKKIDDHLATLSQPERDALQRIRNIVNQHVPDAQEVISYGMPAFRYKTKYLIAYQAFKDHMSIFPGSQAIVAFEDQLGAHKISKGTVQFTTDNQLPESLLLGMVRQRISEIDGV